MFTIAFHLEGRTNIPDIEGGHDTQVNTLSPVLPSSACKCEASLYSSIQSIHE